MKRANRILAFILALIFALDPSKLAVGALAQDGAKEKLDYAMISRIREEGLNRSQVMDHISWLSDVYGPRLTGSPAREVKMLEGRVVLRMTEEDIKEAQTTPIPAQSGGGAQFARFQIAADHYPHPLARRMFVPMAMITNSGR